MMMTIKTIATDFIAFCKGVKMYNAYMKPYKAQIREEFRKSVYTFNGVKLYYSPTLLKATGAGVLATSWSIKGYCIAMDDYFKTMEEDEQLFFLYHELGHIRCGHIWEHAKKWYQTFIALSTGKTVIEASRLLEEELEADAFALEHTDYATAIKGLYKISTIAANKEEIDVRCEALGIEKPKRRSIWNITSIFTDAPVISIEDI